jgi:NTE family protein
VKHPSGQKILNLALQGGGSHAAFTWGVLDRLLEDERISIEGISATGSGAFVAAALADGLARGDRAEGQAKLAAFWTEFARASAWSPLRPSWAERLNGWNIDGNPAAILYDLASQVFAPTQLNPLNLSPLRAALTATIDVERVRSAAPLKLFVTASNVRTGKVALFRQSDLTVEHFMAAATLPQVAPAVMIDGEPYWDGGLLGNPAIFPLIYGCRSSDVLIVQLDPIGHAGVPQKASDILDRLNEITFNANLMREMRAIAFVLKLVEEEGASGRHIDRLKRMRVHMIGDPEAMAQLGLASKFAASGEFLNYLKELGRVRAEEWVSLNFEALGVRSSIDIAKTFL